MKKGASWDWPLTLEQVFQGTKCIIKCALALHALDPASPCELDVHVNQESFGWGLQQQLEWLCQPLGFSSQLWKGAEVVYSLIEKQLATVYTALLAMEVITRTAPVIVRTTYLIAG